MDDMNDQPRYPHDPQSPGGAAPQQPAQQPQGQTGWPTNPDTEDTRRFATQSGGYDPYNQGYEPSYQQGPQQGYPAYDQGYDRGYGGEYGPQPTYPERTSATGRRGLTAAVLAGALVLGGVAGVGGAAVYDAVNGDEVSSTSSGSGGGKFESTNSVTVKDGTVEKVAAAVLPSVVKVNVTGQNGAGSGSGIVLSKDGEILTNNHVVAGGDGGRITVSFNDGTVKRAEVVGTDPLTDVAVIKAQDVDDLTPASLGKSGELKVGQTVVAVGSPFGLNATVTTGIVSALHRPVSVSTSEEPQNPFEQGEPQASLSTTYPAIQTDAAINPGNSGGPHVDMSGRVVGINSSIRTASGGVTQGGGSIGLGFAIPIDEVLPIVNQISDGEKPTHARLGVTVSDVEGGSLNQGARLQTVEDGSAAAEAGLRSGDIITKVDDRVIDGSESLVATIRGFRPGDSVEVTYVRGGDTSTATVELGSDEDSSDG